MIGWDTLYIEWLSVNNYDIYRANPLIELLISYKSLVISIVVQPGSGV